MFSSQLVQNMMIKQFSFFQIFEWNTNHFQYAPLCLIFLCYSCVLLCCLLYFQLKLRSYCRLLVFCFVWASSVAFCWYRAASVLFCPCSDVAVQSCCIMWFYVLFFRFSFQNWFHWTQEVASLSLPCTTSLSLSLLLSFCLMACGLSSWTISPFPPP